MSVKSNGATTNLNQNSGQLVVPQHVAIIMDGNGRWARNRKLPRLEGHTAGALAVRRTVEACLKVGVRHLTLFSFSTENWQRSEAEVTGLMHLFEQFLKSELPKLHEGNIRLRAIGDLARLPESVQRSLASVCDATASHDRLDLILAISYGGREEIVAACRKLASRVAANELSPDEICGEMFSGALWTAGTPDPDLLIRTSGEQRISNFLLWQLAYAEMVVTNSYWPDFDEAAFLGCLQEFSARERRFGLTTDQLRNRKGVIQSPEFVGQNSQQTGQQSEG